MGFDVEKYLNEYLPRGLIFIMIIFIIIPFMVLVSPIALFGYLWEKIENAKRKK